MSRAVYTFSDIKSQHIAEKIEFELLDNPGSRAWQYAVMLNNKSRDCTKVTAGGIIKSNSVHVETIYNELVAILKKLNQENICYQGEVPALFDQINQGFMNQAHRFFTENCRIIWDVTYSDFEKQFNLNNLLQRLNILIHQLEPYFPTETKIKYAKIIDRNEIRVINNANETGFDIVPFRQYHSYESADLIMDGYILGKTLLESFLCEDSAFHWDTSGHTMTNGGSCIILSDYRQQIYQSQDFDRWLNQQGLDKQSRFADFPLGNFVPGHKEKLLSMLDRLSSLTCSVEIKIS